jgi:hypothetical protein
MIPLASTAYAQPHTAYAQPQKKTMWWVLLDGLCSCTWALIFFFFQRPSAFRMLPRAKRAEISGQRTSAFVLRSAGCPASKLPPFSPRKSLFTAPELKFFRAGGFPHLPPPPPVCPLASTFQHQLAAHVRAGLCVVFLAIGAFQRYSSQLPLPPLLLPFQYQPAPAAPPSGLCSTYWV